MTYLITTLLSTAGACLNRLRGGWIEGWRIPAIVAMSIIYYFIMTDFALALDYYKIVGACAFFGFFTMGWLASLNPFVAKNFEGKTTWYSKPLAWLYSNTSIYWGNFIGLTVKGSLLMLPAAVLCSPWAILLGVLLPICHTLGYIKMYKWNLAEVLYGAVVLSSLYLVL